VQFAPSAVSWLSSPLTSTRPASNNGCTFFTFPFFSFRCTLMYFFSQLFLCMCAHLEEFRNAYEHCCNKV
jgi:hypothetical protein